MSDAVGASTLMTIEVNVTPELQVKLTRLARHQGQSVEALIFEAIERLVHYKCWFGAEADKGLAAAERGEFIDHEEVAKLIQSRYGS